MVWSLISKGDNTMSKASMDESSIMWRKSHFSNPSGNCVQIAERGNTMLIDGKVLVRDSKDPSGPVLHFTKPEWQAFVAGVKQGEFDLA